MFACLCVCVCMCVCARARERCVTRSRRAACLPVPIGSDLPSTPLPDASPPCLSASSSSPPAPARTIKRDGRERQISENQPLHLVSVSFHCPPACAARVHWLRASATLIRPPRLPAGGRQTHGVRGGGAGVPAPAGPDARQPAALQHAGAASLSLSHSLILSLYLSNMLVPPAEALTVLVHDFFHVLLANNHATCWCRQLK